MGPPLPLLPRSAKKNANKRKGETKEKLQSQGGPGSPSSPSSSWPSSSCRSTISSSSSYSSSSMGGARATLIPALVSRRKARTSGIALSSRKSSLMVGARGCFHPQAFTTLLQSSFVWAAQAKHLTKRLWRDCRSPLPHHQHSLDRFVSALSARYGPIATRLGGS